MWTLWFELVLRFFLPSTCHHGQEALLSTCPMRVSPQSSRIESGQGVSPRVSVSRIWFHKRSRCQTFLQHLDWQHRGLAVDSTSVGSFFLWRHLWLLPRHLSLVRETTCRSKIDTKVRCVWLETCLCVVQSHERITVSDHVDAEGNNDTLMYALVAKEGFQNTVQARELTTSDRWRT